MLRPGNHLGKTANLALIAAAQVLVLALWFSGTAAGPDMARENAAIGPGFPPHSGRC